MCFPQATSSVMGSIRNPTADAERKRVNFDEEAGMTEGLVRKEPVLEEEDDEHSPIEVSVVPSHGEDPVRVTNPSPASSSSVSDTSFSRWSVPPGLQHQDEGTSLQASSPLGKPSGSQASIPEREDLQNLKDELVDEEEHRAIKSNIKSRMPGLVALTLPATPELPPSMHSPIEEVDDSDNESAGSGQHSPVALMTTRRMAPLTTRRLKTRLQDPPTFTPPVSTQLSRCGSTVAQRRVSINSQMVEEAAAAVSNTDGNENQSYTLPGSRTSLASMPSASRMEPARIPSYTGGLRTPLSSKSVPIPQTSKPTTTNMATVDEEQDPLDDESIPKYKKWKSERRWFVWAQYVALLSLVPLLICSIYIETLERVRWLSLGLWRWLALALVVISGRLMSGWLIQILVVLIERHYLLRKRVLYFVYGLRRAVKNCIWLALVLGVWKVIFEANKDEHLSPIVTKILWCFWIASLLWMIKVMAVKVAANSFHRAAYFERIQDNLFHQYVMETLSAPPSFNAWVDFGTGQAVNMADAAVGQEEMASSKGRAAGPDSAQGGYGNTGSRKHLPPGQPGEAEQQGQYAGLQTSKGRMSNGSSVPTAPARQSSATHTPAPIIARSPIPFQQDKLQELTSDTVSAWTLKRLMKIIRSTNMTTYASMFAHQQGEWEIDSETQAKAAAKEIFYNVARPGEKSLQFNDFLNFFPNENASRAFHLFEVNENGNITKKALMKWVVTVYKERRALALTLSDNRTVVAKLHRVLDVVLTAILITIFFLILGVNTSKLLVALSSTLLPSVFVFGNAARSTFESLVFLFVMHPFDVGDRISVDGQSFIVEELNILNTIFLSGSNEKVYYPNSLLSTKPISNFYRSPDQWDSIDFQIHVSTPVEKLGMLKERMTRYIESLPQFWYPAFRIVCKDIQDSNKMFMSLWIQHHLNYQEAGERWQRRSNMILHMKQQMEELAIGYRLPMADITVTGVPVLDVPPVVHY